MYAYILSTAKKLEPFGEHPRDCLIGNRPLERRQDAALRSLGISPVRLADAGCIRDPNAHLVLEDRLYFTPELIAEFVAKSRVRKTSTRCALKQGPVTEHTAVVTQDVPLVNGAYTYALRYEPAARARRMPESVVIDPEQDYEPLPIARHMTPLREPRLPITDRVLIRIDHWVNLWAANLSVPAAGIARSRKLKWRLLRLAAKARSFDQWNVLRATNSIGRDCDIHPTAYVESSVIGSGTQIGAGAVVRGALIGSGCRILNRATVELCVLGDGAHVMNGCTAQFAVLCAGHLTMSNRVSFSLCGRDTFVGDGVTLDDFRVDGETVRVLKDGVSVDSGMTFLGGCLGHGAYLGAGCVLAPGRAIPNGWRVSRETGVITSTQNGSDLQGLNILLPALPAQRYA
jgi:acetyltransferase-like isoleucine patch superfamily enzyme